MGWSLDGISEIWKNILSTLMIKKYFKKYFVYSLMVSFLTNLPLPLIFGVLGKVKQKKFWFMFIRRMWSHSSGRTLLNKIHWHICFWLILKKDVNKLLDAFIVKNLLYFNYNLFIRCNQLLVCVFIVWWMNLLGLFPKQVVKEDLSW